MESVWERLQSEAAWTLRQQSAGDRRVSQSRGRLSCCEEAGRLIANAPRWDPLPRAISHPDKRGVCVTLRLWHTCFHRLPTSSGALLTRTGSSDTRPANRNWRLSITDERGLLPTFYDTPRVGQGRRSAAALVDWEFGMWFLTLFCDKLSRSCTRERTGSSDTNTQYLRPRWSRSRSPPLKKDCWWIKSWEKQGLVGRFI